MPDYENQASVSNSIEILNEVNFESEESILLDQTMLSTLNYDSNASSVTDNKTFWKTQVRSRGGGGRGKGGGWRGGRTRPLPNQNKFNLP